MTATAARSLGGLRRLAGEVLVVLPAAVFLVLCWSQLFHGFQMLRDSGAYSSLGEGLLRGQLPIRDLWDQKPGAIAPVDAAALAFGGDPVRDLLALDLAYSLLILAAAAWLLRAVSGRLVTVVVLLFFVSLYRAPSYLEYGNLTEQYALLPMFAALGCAVRALRQQAATTRWALACGLLSGVAACFKPTAATPAAALAVTLVVAVLRARNRRLAPVLASLAGAALPVLALVAAYLAVGTPANRIYEDLVLYNAHYSPVHDRTWALQAIASWVLHWEVLLAPLLVVLRLRSGAVSEASLRVFHLATAAMAADAVALILPGWFYGHYFLLLLPSMTLAFGWSLGSLPARLPPPAKLVSRGLGLLGVAALTVLVVQLANPLWTPQGILEFVSGSPVASVYPIEVMRIDSYCRPGQPMWAWGNEPELYVLSGHPSASRYLYLAPLQMSNYQNRHRVDEVLADFQRSHPCVIVDTASTNEGRVPPLDPAQRASWTASADPRYGYTRLGPLYDYVETHYQDAGKAGQWELWVPLAT